MFYNDFIQDIIDTRGQWNIPKGEYKERHHIIPRCLGGSNKKENIIWLYAQEHYEAHKLLFIENPNNSKLALAWHNFHQRKASKNCEDIMLVSGEEYNNLKLLYHKVAGDKVSGKNNPMYGRVGNLNPAYNKNAFEDKTSEELNIIGEKISCGLSGSNNGMFNKKHSNAAINKIKEKRQGKSTSKRPIICIETKEIFESIRAASKKYTRGRIDIACKNKTRTANGYHWAYLEEMI